MHIRKNQAALTPEERKAFVKAVLALKNSIPSQMGLTNRYDDYVQMHMNSMMVNPGWAHGRPAFLPWHRAFLSRFELDLQAVDPQVTLPYWDWTVDQAADATAPGSPWTVEFMGGDGIPADQGRVKVGPFAFAGGQWELNVVMDPDPNFLQRALGSPNDPAASTLPTTANVQGALAVTPYDRSPWDRSAQPSFRNRIEGWYGAGSIHNRVHLWVGGTMTGMCSPNDPIFFLNHANVDRLWARWQLAHPEQAYVPADTAANSLRGQRLHDKMQPFGVTPFSMLDHVALDYQYDDEVSAPERPTHKVFIPAIMGRPDAGGPEAMPALPGMPDMHRGGGHMMGPMFDLSPEDKAAGGHDTGMGSEEVAGDATGGASRAGAGDAGGAPLHPPAPGRAAAGHPAPAFGLSPEDKAAGGHDTGM